MIGAKHCKRRIRWVKALEKGWHEYKCDVCGIIFKFEERK